MKRFAVSVLASATLAAMLALPAAARPLPLAAAPAAASPANEKKPAAPSAANASGNSTGNNTGNNTENKVEPLPFAELSAFAEALARIKASYVEPVDDKQLLEGAIAGMLATLDPHSSYLNARDSQRLQESTTGEYTGVGLEVVPERGVFRVVSAIDNAPADKAGLKPGDLLLRVDGELTQGLSHEQLVQKLRGPKDSKVVVQVGREQEAGPLDLTIVRGVIHPGSVRQELLDGGIGYLRLSQFQVQSGREVMDALGKLKAASPGGLKGLVLDLRNNPGGLVPAAIAISDAFLSSGTIVSTRGRGQGSDMAAEAKPDDLLPGVPMVVLINAGSASASEIVAGALQDHHRAVVVGERSFGKGSVQTVMRLHGEHTIKLTTARYYTPSGRSIQAEGIVPDVEVPAGKLVADAGPARIREADLPRALDDDQDTKSAADKPVADQKPDGKSPTDKRPAEKNTGSKSVAERARQLDDVQLATAVHLLKGMAALQK